MTNKEPITYENILLSPISFEMISGQQPLPLFPSECAYELLIPLLNALKISDTRIQVTALLLRICSVLEGCSTVSRLAIRDRVETTLKSYSTIQALDISHIQNGHFGGTESIDLACVLAGLVHHSGVSAVTPPLPCKAPGEAAVANLRSKLDAYVAWKATKGVPPVPRSTHGRPSSVAGFFKPLLKTANTHQRPHSAYGYNKTQRHSYATFAGSDPRVAFVRSPSPKCKPTRWLTCSPQLSTIKEPENDHPNGSTIFFPEWSPYRPLEAKTARVMMSRTTSRREKDPLTASQINPFVASPPA
jgi:hypothetical protein